METEGEARKKWFLTGYLLCALFFGFSVWAFHPGLMSADSVANLTNGRQMTFFDINSPIVSYVWGLLDRIVSGPSLMFILQNLIFWTAAAIFWQTASRKSFKLGLALVLFGLTPHILSQLMVVWKDISMGVTLFLAVALVYWAKTTGNKIVLLLSVLPLAFGTAARLNSVTAVLPIAVWSGYIACQLFEIKKAKFAGAAIGLVYFAALGFGAYFITYHLTEGRTTYPFQQNYLYDLAAISAERGEAIFPEYIKRYENFSPDLIKPRYNTRSINDLIYKDIPNPGDLPPLKFTENPEEIAALKTLWRETVWQNPGTYAAHRLKVFANLVGLNRAVAVPYLYEGFKDNPPEYRGSENLGFQILKKYFGAFRRSFPQTFFFRAVVWILLCGYFLYRAMKNRLAGDWDIVCVLSISSLLFTFAYLPTTPSTEFRYLFWSAIASAVAVIFGVYLSAQKEDNLVFKILSKISRIKR